MALTVGARSPLFVVSVMVSAFVLWAHRSNMARLRQGTEPRFGARTTEDTR
jgi:glycerol-3-phosphate acyltransferase PlsY